MNTRKNIVLKPHNLKQLRALLGEHGGNLSCDKKHHKIHQLHGGVLW